MFEDYSITDTPFLALGKVTAKEGRGTSAVASINHVIASKISIFELRVELRQYSGSAFAQEARSVLARLRTGARIAVGEYARDRRDGTHQPVRPRPGLLDRSDGPESANAASK